MVERPKRSKGCFNCRRRKKGCDLSRPSCGQCLKSKLNCQGYDDSLAVVAYTPSTSTVNEKLCNSAIELKYIESFWALYLPASGNPHAIGRDWTSVINERYLSDNGLKSALLAVTLSRIGQQIGDRSLVLSGSKHYGNCLRELSKSIEATKSIEEVIATCLLLGSYEILAASESPGFNWQNHSQGIGKIIQSRGPHQYISEDSHELFVGARQNIIFAAMVTRQATFLNSPEWLSVPWENAPKKLYDQMVDLFAQVPGLFESFDTNSAFPHIENHTWEPFLHECWRFDGALQSWRRNFLASHAVSNTPTGPRPPASINLDSPLAPDTIVDPDSARAISLYWTTCICLYTTLRIVWQETNSPLYLLPPRTDPMQYAVLISRSLPYFNSPNAGEVLYLDYSLCIGTALQYLAIRGELDSSDATRMVNIFTSDNRDSLGDRIGEFLHTIQGDPSRMKIESPGEGAPKVIENARKWWGGGKRKVAFLR